MELATIIVMLALAEYIYFTARVGAARGKTGVEAPACTGNEQFERVFRVQQNTLEQLIIFVPATYAFAYYVDNFWVVVPGVIFLIGRLMYSNGYTNNPAARAPGMIATLLSNALMVAVTLGMLVWGMI
jgi:uncharacterized membrane protein YecN with MAPEG domain